MRKGEFGQRLEEERRVWQRLAEERRVWQRLEERKVLT